MFIKPKATKDMKTILFIILTSLTLVCYPAEVKRSSKQVRAFMKTHICPGTGKIETQCKGFIVDHIDPIACGGLDHPSNMQYQTIAEAKAKDKWERKNCQMKKKRV